MAEFSKHKDRIVLVKVEAGMAVHPLPLIYLGDALKKAGYEVRVFNIFEKERNRTIEDILEMKPLFVGFSSLTGGQTKHTYEMSKAIRQRDKDIKIVWGGVHPTMLPEDCLKEDCIDVVCMGEGEEVVIELAHYLSDGRDLKNIGSIGYKENGEFIINPRRSFISNIDTYAPNWSLLDDFERCVTVLPDGRRQVDFVGSRGCPYNCGFCYNLKFNQRKWRKHSFEYVVDNIGYLRKKYDIRAIMFHDDNFYVDMQRAIRILEKLKEMDVVVTNCMIRLDVLNEDVLKKLRGLGVRRVFVGWEAGSDRILKLINKGLTRESILEKFELLSKFPDIAVTAASIMGFPTETWEEVCQTIDLGVRLAEMVPDIIVEYQAFLPYPGSHLYQMAIDDGFSLPKNMSDYDAFDVYKSGIDLTWLPWTNKNTKTLFYRIDKYGKLLTHSKGSNMLRTLGKNLFYRISKARLKKKFFFFPWEIGVLYYFNRYYNPKCPI